MYIVDTPIEKELRVVARHRKRGTGYVVVKTGPHAPELSMVTTVAGTTYIVHTDMIEFTPPDTTKTERNLGVLIRTLT